MAALTEMLVAELGTQRSGPGRKLYGIRLRMVAHGLMRPGLSIVLRITAMARPPKLTSEDRQTLQRAGYDSLVLGGAGGLQPRPSGRRPRQRNGDRNPGHCRDFPRRNDGLNTVIPYADDAYYAARPRLGIRAGQGIRIDDHFALQKTKTRL